MSLKKESEQDRVYFQNRRRALFVASQIRDLAARDSIDRIDMEICLKSAENVNELNYNEAIQWARDNFHLDIIIHS